MSAENPTSKTELEANIVKLEINWPASKETICHFVGNAWNYELNHDVEFHERFGQSKIANLLYNLGHNGRGIADFPKSIILDIPKPQQFSIQGAFGEAAFFETTTTFPHLFNQIADAIEEYAVEYRKREDISKLNPDAFKEEIDDLRDLIKQSEGKRVIVIFRPPMMKGDYGSKLRSLQGKGYHYIDMHVTPQIKESLQERINRNL